MDNPCQSKRRLRHGEYTVGWLTAILSEQNAARIMLDERHEQLPTNENDDNTYILGRVGKHNVVIARPAQYGTNSAANTAANMIRTFQSLRFVLMVGIGGGAPGPPVSENSQDEDIRLGDIVVGFPKDFHSGVLQYDMGKLESHRRFTIRSHLNKPPKALLTAVGTLQSEHDYEEGEMAQYLRNALEYMHSKRTKKLKAYHFPGRDKDLLFKADYNHKDKTMDCSTCDLNQTERRIDRETDDPVVHYGLIASGNTVMKSAQQRDELRDRDKVICFEMEAAGLVDNFPCLVIRGICDYSDDHKNDLWQPYAALASAAYAKDLLRVIQLKEVENTKAIAEVVQGLTERIEMTQQKKQHSEILRWLSPLEPQKRHQDMRSIRVPGTGEWLLEETRFQDWFTGRYEHRVLCCSGIPGAGKSVLASLVIDHITKLSEDSEPRFGLAFVYCDYWSHAVQTPTNLTASLLRQLLQILPSFPQEVLHTYERTFREHRQLEQGDVDSMLLHACQQFDSVYICVDALDELEVQYKEAFLASLRKLIPSIQLFITGRPHIPVVVDQYFPGALKITIEAKGSDIETFVASKIGEDSARDEYLMDEKLKAEILEKIGRASQNMFLLPALQIQMILDERTKADRRSALDKLPEELSDAFDNTMDRIKRQSRAYSGLALKILMWVHLAQRPLHIDELFDALAVKIGDKALNTDNFPSQQSWLDCCLGLVVMDEETSTFRLVHFSFGEYLQAQGDSSYFQDGHDRIAKTCLTYLCFDRVATPQTADTKLVTRLDTKQLLADFPFLDYAACQWGHHLREAKNLSEESRHLSVAYLLQPQSGLRSSLVFLYKFLGTHSPSLQDQERFSENFSGLHIAAYFGVPAEVFRRLIHGKSGVIDSKDLYGNRTPLSYAAEAGHVEMVQLLINTNQVSIDGGGTTRTPLSYALEGRHAEVIRLLIGANKGLNSLDADSQTALHFAADAGKTETIRSTTSVGRVDLNSGDANSRTVLSGAVGQRYPDVTGFPIDKSPAHADLRDETGQTPLIHAAAKGDAEALKLLLNTSGVDINHKDQFGRTAISLAAAGGHLKAIELLLGVKEVDLNLESWATGEMPLSCAVKSGHIGAVKLLIETGRIHLNSKCSYSGRTALSYAAEGGYMEIVKLLVETGQADANSKDKYHQTPISYAAQEGYIDIVKFFIETGQVDISAEDVFHQTLLSYAAQEGHIEIAKLLIETGRIDVHSKCSHNNRTALSYAAGGGHTEIVRLLINEGRVDTGEEDRYHRTPLSYAAEGGHIEVVKHLIGTGQLNAGKKDKYDWTPLSYAVDRGHTEVIKLLSNMF
ncbi:hypothetical protein TWF106_000145 [Orbilia oligospora]|uniref:Uncharacterized protein n=3 Tax=Orbilia oligospora TaxID=2813651 RepID=A0A7C8R155_ORBOL|nr:hypothetical protein TWF106_000145 [Orbilia oligospora]